MHTATATDLLATIGRSGQLSPEALENLKLWLEDPALVEFAPEIQALVEQEAEHEAPRMTGRV